MPSTGPQDIVFCKNVAIYFRADVTRKLIAGLHDTLAPDGYLLLGHAESLWQMSEGFTLVEHDGRILLQEKRTLSHGARAPVADRNKPNAGLGGTGLQPCPRRHVRRNTTSASRPSAPANGTSPNPRSVALVASCPTFVPALLLLGGVYVHRGRFDEAMAAGRSGVEGERSRAARAPAARHDRRAPAAPRRSAAVAAPRALSGRFARARALLARQSLPRARRCCARLP